MTAMKIELWDNVCIGPRRRQEIEQFTAFICVITPLKGIDQSLEILLTEETYLILKNYVTIPTIFFYDMNAIRTSWMLLDFEININKSAIFLSKSNNIQ